MVGVGGQKGHIIPAVYAFDEVLDGNKGNITKSKKCKVPLKNLIWAIHPKKLKIWDNL